jgi:NitT/TauT family transport system ATP-binding protein
MLAIRSEPQQSSPLSGVGDEFVRSDELVRVSDVGFQYGAGTVALENVSLGVREGEVLGIVGPSGCGKSTLLRLFAGLKIPTSGTVLFAPEAASAACAVTMVFQNETLLPWMTVHDNAALYAKFQPIRERRRTAAQRKARVDELLHMVGLDGFAKAYPYELSGGMKRRLAFVAAVAASPALLLLDEPFSSVDEPTQVQIHRDILKIIQQLNMTVVLVTHDLAEAVTLCDRVVIMTNRPGRLYSEHVMEFGAGRDVLQLRQTDEFHHAYAKLWHDLSKQMISSQPSAEE